VIQGVALEPLAVECALERLSGVLSPVAIEIAPVANPICRVPVVSEILEILLQRVDRVTGEVPVEEIPLIVALTLEILLKSKLCLIREVAINQVSLIQTVELKSTLKIFDSDRTKVAINKKLTILAIKKTDTTIARRGRRIRKRSIVRRNPLGKICPTTNATQNLSISDVSLDCLNPIVAKVDLAKTRMRQIYRVAVRIITRPLPVK
jgi:hypothetical protein